MIGFDERLDVVVELVEKMREAGEEPLGEVGKLAGGARLRMLEAAIDVESSSLVVELIVMIQHSEVSHEEAQLLIDHLRTWKLSDEERELLLTAAMGHLGKSPLLDRVIEMI